MLSFAHPPRGAAPCPRAVTETVYWHQESQQTTFNDEEEKLLYHQIIIITIIKIYILFL